MDVAYAFERADIVNHIGRVFKDVYCVVYREDCCDRLDVQEYIPQIVAATVSDSTAKKEIASDSIWDCVYLANGDQGEFDGRYVHVRIYDDADYEDDGYKNALILWPSDSPSSYIRALARYVKETYHVSVSILEETSYDWKKEYFHLIRDIRYFIEDRQDIKSIEDLHNLTVKMDDVQDFGEEKRIWIKLKRQREKIISHDKDKEPPIDLDDWKYFLSGKYNGRCQLCGELILMEE
ncbi:MAG: hypothetical protein LUE92_16740 [Clostridiales bacterium]|nr:hypothetical protein [Clostridiales bacterium]